MSVAINPHTKDAHRFVTLSNVIMTTYFWYSKWYRYYANSNS